MRKTGSAATSKRSTSIHFRHSASLFSCQLRGHSSSKILIPFHTCISNNTVAVDDDEYLAQRGNAEIVEPLSGHIEVPLWYQWPGLGMRRGLGRDHWRWFRVQSWRRRTRGHVIGVACEVRLDIYSSGDCI